MGGLFTLKWSKSDRSGQFCALAGCDGGWEDTCHEMMRWLTCRRRSICRREGAFNLALWWSGELLTGKSLPASLPSRDVDMSWTPLFFSPKHGLTTTCWCPVSLQPTCRSTEQTTCHGLPAGPSFSQPACLYCCCFVSRNNQLRGLITCDIR